MCAGSGALPNRPRLKLHRRPDRLEGVGGAVPAAPGRSARARRGSRATMSWPSTMHRPSLALTMPQMMLISVVLPAPFGPSRAKISPRRISRSTCFRARSPRRRSCRDRIWRSRVRSCSAFRGWGSPGHHLQGAVTGARRYHRPCLWGWVCGVPRGQGRQLHTGRQAATEVALGPRAASLHAHGTRFVAPRGRAGLPRPRRWLMISLRAPVI